MRVHSINILLYSLLFRFKITSHTCLAIKCLTADAETAQTTRSTCCAFIHNGSENRFCPPITKLTLKSEPLPDILVTCLYPITTLRLHELIYRFMVSEMTAPHWPTQIIDGVFQSRLKTVFFLEFFPP